MQHLRREVDRLKRKLLALSAYVEESVQRAVKSVSERDEKLAQRVIDTDFEIDEMEVDVEEDCLKILALHQPVAIDLRFIIAVLKINNDLERIGDLAVNIAERAVSLSKRDKINSPFDFQTMAERVQKMLQKALDALVNGDAKLAREVLVSDDEIDEMNRQMYDSIKMGIRQDPDNVDTLIQVLAISRNLERIADHTSNIAEDVIYMVDGDIIRHGHRQY
ncbi:MAG: phosphate signaling complex protein PhoU [bacterium]|nr:phosphate signaling complex protein PhoU [bacterium]